MNMIKKMSISIMLIIVSITPLTQCKDKNSSIITEKELKQHVEFLAADEQEGRYIGSEGLVRSIEYCTEIFKRANLLSFNSSKSYLQSFPVRLKYLSGLDFLKVTNQDGQISKIRKNFRMFLSGSQTTLKTPLKIVFAGHGISLPEHNWDDFSNLDIKGKVVIFLTGAPAGKTKSPLPQKVLEKYQSRRSLDYKFGKILGKKPAAVFFVPVLDGEADMSKFKDVTTGIQVTRDKGNIGSNSTMPHCFTVNPIIVNQLIAESGFTCKTYDPLNNHNHKPFELKSKSIEIDYKFINKRIHTSNAIGLVKGYDSSLNDKFLVVSAHIDHLPPINGQICNGADDNASGCASLLELAELISASPLKRSVIFVLFTGEESSLLGSSYFVQNPPVPLEKISANINLDMMGGTVQENLKDRSHFVVGFEDISQNLLDIAQSVNNKHNYWPVVFRYQKEVKGNSDHSSFHNVKIPSLFFWSGRHKHWHQPSDDPQTLDYKKMEKLTRLVHGILKETDKQL